jgi:hypothetical protein
MAPEKKNIEAQADGGTMVGLFRDQPSAERAIQSLKAAGFSEEQIGVAVRDRAQQEAITEGTGTQAAEGAATGAMGGGGVGGVIGLLAGVGALAIPGIGPIIAGGALASTLAGAGIGAAAGGLIGALVGMGIPEEDARHFERGFQEGGVLVTVQAGARSTEARQVLNESEADLGSLSRSIKAAGEGEDEVRGAATAAGSDDTRRLELREEQLERRERVQAGEVRLRKEVVTGTEEEVRVEKTPVVREEIEVRTRQVQDTERVSEPVRREEARIEGEGDVRMRETGGRGSEAWRGNERRYQEDASYTGPERRLARR